MINELALKYNDAHWYLNKNLFLPKFRHDDLIQSIKKETQYKAQDGSVQDKKRERFIKHYYDKYQTPELPAVWMVAEVLPLGSWSMIFANDYRKQLDKNSRFSAQAAILKIFLDVISPGSEWAKHLRDLIKQHPQIDVKKMGFKKDWESDSFWNS